jgi:hypothetical protein
MHNCYVERSLSFEKNNDMKLQVNLCTKQYSNFTQNSIERKRIKLTLLVARDNFIIILSFYTVGDAAAILASELSEFLESLCRRLKYSKTAY